MENLKILNIRKKYQHVNHEECGRKEIIKIRVEIKEIENKLKIMEKQCNQKLVLS